MRVIDREEFFHNQDEMIRHMKTGSVFVYPTDTVYGIGCNAMVDSAVKRIREIKNKFSRPFSVIAPSVEWIQENFVMTPETEEWLEKLPGPYTLILNIKTEGIVSEHVNNGLSTVGVRIPDHWISKAVSAIGYPIITTSANHVGEDYMTSIDDMDPGIKSKVDFIIYEGEKHGRASRIVHLEGQEVKVRKR